MVVQRARQPLARRIWGGHKRKTPVFTRSPTEYSRSEDIVARLAALVRLKAELDQLAQDDADRRLALVGEARHLGCCWLRDSGVHGHKAIALVEPRSSTSTLGSPHGDVGTLSRTRGVAKGGRQNEFSGCQIRVERTREARWGRVLDKLSVVVLGSPAHGPILRYATDSGR